MLQLLTEALDQGATAEAMLRIIQQAQERIGELWQRNEISIAQEHLATAISQLALAHLFPRARRARPLGKKALVACVEGELHDFPARLAADQLELAGFEVLFLGANVPTDSLVSMVRSAEPDLLALSCTMSFHLPAVRSAISAVKDATGGKLPVLVGGHAFTWAPELSRELGVAGYGKDGDALVSLARTLVGVPR